MVAPAAIASERHSRRTANQRRPMPGVTFVSSTNDQVAGHRKPRTIAAASRSVMLPPKISGSAIRSPTASNTGPTR